MKPGVLLLDSLSAVSERKLEAVYQVHRFFDGEFPEPPVATNIRAIITSAARGASTQVVDRLERLELIAIRGAGTDAVDLTEARRRSIQVTTPHRPADR